MSKTYLSETDGFTPVIDEIMAELGLTPALVFGRVWRYCQMPMGVCTASQGTIAGDLKLSRETVCRALKVLVEAEYLEEVEHDGITKTYSDTGRAGLETQTRAFVKEKRSKKIEQPVIVDHTSDPKPVIVDHMGCDLRSQEGVIYDHTKIGFKKGDKTEQRDSSAFSFWPKIQSQLQSEMSKATYETWVSPTFPIGWQGDSFRVGCLNQFTADWLTARIEKTATRMLQGFAENQAARVEFVLAEKAAA